MILKELELYNIGPYKGKNLFEFQTTNNKNLILIGGKNGAGKTTFLTSIKIALYGPLAYGLRTTSKSYFNIIRSLLNDNIDYKKDTFYLKIKFSKSENFIRDEFELVRKWNFYNEQIIEEVFLKKNNIDLGKVEINNFIENMRSTIPPTLLDLCFFDGENIQNLSEKNNLSNFIKELSTNFFNIELFKSLDTNLNNYLKTNINSKIENKLVKEIDTLELDIKKLQVEISSIQNSILNINNELDTKKEIYEELKIEFSTHGGLLFDDRKEIQVKINEIENTRKNLNEEIKDFIGNELPFFIAFPLLPKITNQLISEEKTFFSNFISKEINQLSFEDIFKKSDIEINKQNINKFQQILINTLTEQETPLIIHNASKNEEAHLFNVIKNINSDRLNTIKRKISIYNDYRVQLKKLKDKLDDNETTPEFNNMIKNMERISNEIHSLVNEKTKKADLLKERMLELENLKSKHQKNEQNLFNINKKKSSFQLTHKVLNVSKKYQYEQIKKKIKDIEYFSSKMINKLLNKKNFINQISIDPDNFNVNLFTNNGNSIKIDSLSAGEQELLILSVFWGTVQAANKELPIVLDTLLGRLDQSHKSSILTKLIPNFGKQCIILSTDSEITKPIYHSVQPYISKEYTLSYNNKDQKTDVLKGFFDYKIKDVKQSNEF